MPLAGSFETQRFHRRVGHGSPWLLLGCLVLASCGDAPTRADRTLVVAVASSPTSLVPNAANDPDTLSLLTNVYETLVDFDRHLGLQPGLAESWHTPDELTWIFSLRRNVRRHDGGILTAQDVVASLKHAATDPGSCRRAQLSDVASVEATDPLTVVVRTQRPIDTLGARLGNVFIGSSPSRPGDAAVGTGHYRIRSRTSSDVVLEAFPGHRSGIPPLAAARFRTIPDTRERIRALLDESVHLLTDLPATAAALASNAGVRTLSRRDGLRVLFLGYDCARARSPYVSVARNPFRDVRVRQAMALALDRRAFVAGPVAGYAQLADQITTPGELGAFATDLVSRPYDSAGARRLLQATGYAAGFRVRLDFAGDPDTLAVARLLARDLGRVGIRLDLEPLSRAELARCISARDTSLFLQTWASETGDGRLSYEYLLHSRRDGLGQANGGGYSQREMDILIQQSTGLTLGRERQLLLARLATKVALDVPIVPLYARVDTYGLAPGVVFEPRLDGQVRVAELRWAE